MFSDPQLLSKLAANPRTQKHLADPSFMQMLQMIQQNPKLASNLLQPDPRRIDVLGVAMGIDIQGYSRPEGSDELPPGVVPQDTPGASSRPSPMATSPSPKFEPQTQTKSSSSPPPPSEDVEMLDDEEATAKRDAEAAKKLGSEAYKRSDFAVAAEQFAKAWDLSPKDITYLTNLGAAYLEQGEYDKAIEACEKAVDEGRSVSAIQPLFSTEHFC
jgi:stress-induced-phosphoprotein 1